jgi:LDH2 family malate/lactate/ureidoglycolate dehydrogenase
MHTISLSLLHSFCCDALCAVGVPPESAALTADSLTQADARGLASHGLARLLPQYLNRLRRGSTRPLPRISVVRSRTGAALIDGDGGLGQVVGRAAMAHAIELARTGGVGVVGVRNSSHFGTGAFFVEQAIHADMIGMALTNAPANMPPAGGRSRYFGTNPLALGVPCGEERPIVLDMATSVVARGKIVMAQKEGKAIPPGWAIDEYGIPTEDAAAALRGAVLPMAGYKGAGLALMIDALCGVLTGAAFGAHIVDLYSDGAAQQDVGHFFMALAIDTFMPVEMFKARMDMFVREVRDQPRQPGVERILLPGELEYEMAEHSRREGVMLSPTALRELDECAAALEIATLSARMAG